MFAQLQSRFLCLPYDIRYEIYKHLIPPAVHVSIEEGHVRISECIPQPPVDQMYPGAECKEGLSFRPGPHHPKDPHSQQYARRLMSTWGPHWICQEHASRLREDDNGSCGESVVEVLMQVCRAINEEVGDIITQRTEIIVAGLSCVDALTSGNCYFYESGLSFHNVRKLTLIFRLSSIVADWIIMNRGGKPFYPWHKFTSPQPAASAEIETWERLASTLSQMSNLKRLSIWVDRAGDEGWDRMDERALMSTLAPLATLPDLDFWIDLPERRDGCQSLAPFKVRRRLPQRHYASFFMGLARTFMVKVG